METGKDVIGTFLYAASPRSYEVFRLIFTRSKMVIVSMGWRKKNVFADLIDILYWLLVFPFEGPTFDGLLMRRWLAVKDDNRGRPAVSYDSLESEEIAKMNALWMLFREISIISYPRVRNVRAVENPMTKDYRVRINAGFLASPEFLIPESSVDEFRGLIAKTALAQRLEILE
jgi:hypothetical protein